MSETACTHTLAAAEDTQRLGQRLGQQWRAAMQTAADEPAPWLIGLNGELQTAADAAAAPWLIGLNGEVGAGKTTLAQGFFAGIGYPDGVSSPTYSLVNHYPSPPLNGWHLDLYRLEDAAELAPLELDEILASPRSVMLIEWPEKARALLPATDMDIALRHIGGDGRQVRCELLSERAKAVWS